MAGATAYLAVLAPKAVAFEESEHPEVALKKRASYYVDSHGNDRQNQNENDYRHHHRSAIFVCVLYMRDYKRAVLTDLAEDFTLSIFWQKNKQQFMENIAKERNDEIKSRGSNNSIANYFRATH